MYSFTASGHENLLATHRTTLEFTKDGHLTKRGDCILGINAAFSLEEIKKQHFKKIKIIITTGSATDELTAEYNPTFNHPTEMVIRMSRFIDSRTFAINAEKAAKHIKRELVDALKDPKKICIISVEHTN